MGMRRAVFDAFCDRDENKFTEAPPPPPPPPPSPRPGGSIPQPQNLAFEKKLYAEPTHKPDYRDKERCTLNPMT